MKISKISNAEIRNLSNLRIQTQEEITRIKNRMARWFSIYFPEIKDVYRDPDAVSGLMVIKQAPLPCDIRELGVEGVNKHIYFIAETKGTTLLDRNELRGVEDLKIQCAKAHFAAISNDSVVYDVVDSYDKLMQVVME